MELYYNSCLISYPNGSIVTRNDYVNYNIEYVLSEPCKHVTMDMVTVIKPSTCIENGEQSQKCISCGFVEITEIPMDSEYGHRWHPTSYIGPTCVKSGIEILTCKYCYQTSQEVLKPLGHKYTSPTCTEDSKCIRCGVVNSVALGHDLDFRGQCSRCDHKENLFNNWLHDEAIPGINNIGQNIINGWNGTVVPNLQNAGEAISNVLKNTGEKLEEFGTNFYEFFFPGEDGKGFGKNTGIVGDGNDNDDDHWFSGVVRHCQECKKQDSIQFKNTRNSCGHVNDLGSRRL